MIALRYFQDNLLGSGVDDLLYLVIEILNSLTENGVQIVISLVEILSKMSGLI